MVSPELVASQDKSESVASEGAPSGSAPAGAEALERLARLNESLRARSYAEETPAEPQPSETETRAPHKVRPGLFGNFPRPGGRTIKSLIALAVALALGWVPLQRLLSTTSAEATINARLINLRAPIDGKVTVLAPSIAVGTAVEPGERLLKITNLRADRRQLDELRRTVNTLRLEIGAQKKRLAKLKGVQADLRSQRDAFQDGRVRQLEARAAELAVAVKTAEAHREDARKSLDRSKKLNARGQQTIATLLHAERDMKVAETKVEAARIRLDANKIELEGARKGLFVGDSYNDLPRSAQRFGEIGQEIVDVGSRLEERQARVTFLEKELAEESKYFSGHSVADVTATAHGRIWEALTANGEEVRSGQDLLRILDCGGAVVTATVSESVYNKLWIGQPATFRLRGESKKLKGSVVALTGLTAAASNFAIEQTALTREPYHVTIAVPTLAARNTCSIGRTGQVVFNTSGGAAELHAAPAKTSASALKPGIDLP